MQTEFEIKNGVLEKCIPEQNETSVTVPEGVKIIPVKSIFDILSVLAPKKSDK